MTEETQALISTRSNSSSCRQSLKHTSDLELPAVETLRLTDEIRSLKPSTDKPLLGRASREDLLAQEMNLTTHKIPDEIHEDGTGSEPSGIESSSTSVLRENMSRCNYGLRSTNFNSQEELTHASNLIATEPLKWPSPMNLETCRTAHGLDKGRVPSTRKRQRTCDIGMDENLEAQASTVSNLIQNDTFSNSFTPINRKKSTKLEHGHGWGDGTAPRFSDGQSSAEPSVGHDGPLISKGASKFEPYRAALLGSVRLAEELESEDELTSAQPRLRSAHDGSGRTGKRKNSTLYDYEEAAVYAEAGMESRHFRTARSFGEAVFRKKAGKAFQSQQSELSGNPTDSMSITQ